MKSLFQLKLDVVNANKRLVAEGLVTLTWGNVSAINRESGLVAIKPSGVPYDALDPDDIPILDLEGNQVESSLNPSSDTPTHLELYRQFPTIGAVVHTHSPVATAFSQAGRELPCLGTTHADHFNGTVPVASALTEAEVEAGYEHSTGASIVELFKSRGLDPLQMPAVLLQHHAPFTWGKTADKAVDNAVALEMCCRMARDTYSLAANTPAIPGHILHKHQSRKHGPDAYYGQS